MRAPHPDLSSEPKEDTILLVSGVGLPPGNSMNPKISAVLTLPLLAAIFVIPTKSADAQVVQLPTVRFFNVRTVVSVPDGGTFSLGGINRSSNGSFGRGVPGLGNVPYGGRLFRNRAIGGNSSVGRSAVLPRIIVMSELEQDVLAEADRRRKETAIHDPNGSAEVQKKADFMSRNIGRKRKR